ncbi:rhodanese domain protein [Sulfuriferula multivorans]|uniref:Rhodanese domain protein n=1 Tax=Sulfuriferula multivorans TaxID=1559896 RepID=A0A401JEF0_9PROT|nr:rhodanese-like domain-containing protein [Sulfuriferula multivorans]GBL45992.1 rhodanese domain protein [Sulfuriferula multivorans]
MSMTPQQLVEEAKAQIGEIDANSAAQRISAGAVVIDVREPAEFDAGCLPNAVNIPRGVLEFKTSDHPALANKDVELLLYCKTGGRSALAALSLQRLGYAKPVSVAGGFEAWVNAGQKVVKDTTNFGG